jgi:putative membrane protein
MSAPRPTGAARRLRVLRGAALAAVALVPLAFAGLYIAALGDPAANLDRVPVAIVNDDELITQTADDGTETTILAGRQLVTELTGSDSPADLDWRLTNDADAREMLDSGEVYAVLRVPRDFSRSIISSQGDDPEQARVEITTDDSHSYVSGVIASALGEAMVAGFGTDITEQFVVGVFDQVGAGFAESADGARQLADGAEEAADGADDLADGVAQYTDGVGQLASGADDLANGVDDYADGVGEFADGMGDLAAQTTDLGQLGDGVAAYTGGVSQLSAALDAAVQDLADDPTDPVALATVQAISAQLSDAAAGGAALGSGAAGLGGLADGIGQLAEGADQLAEGGEQLDDGVTQLTDGASELAVNGSTLASGASDLAAGIGELADGSGELADGLEEGAEQFTDTGTPTEDLASVIASPIGSEISTDNRVDGTGSALATYLVPLALWVGALVAFLALRPLARRTLASSAGSGRLLAGTLLRAGAVTGIQALLLVVLLHTAVGVSWTLLPATLVFSLVASAAFTAFHAALTIAFGRAGLIASFILLALQLAAAGLVLPTELLAPPFAAISPFLPLSWATTGMQQILTSGSGAAVAGSAAALLVFGALSVGLAAVALRRTRRAAAIGLLPASA